VVVVVVVVVMMSGYQWIYIFHQAVVYLLTLSLQDHT
jgi:hypothetical protein